MIVLRNSYKYLLFLAVFWCTRAWAQTAEISGYIKGGDDEALEGVTIGVKENQQQFTYSKENGSYSLTIDAGKPLTILFLSPSYQIITHSIIANPGERINFSPTMKFKNNLTEIEVTDLKSRAGEYIRIDPLVFNQLPSTTGNIEDIIKTQIGVSSNNELSSGYSVRGGNFDENLVYVNDIEVYRPFLVRSGQQEGLSFANPFMVQNINFSAGGFEARYGDKLSSVLDITYKKPLKFEGNASASLLGGNVQVQGISKNRLVAWNIGSRYRSNVYLLKSLDTRGEYRPTAFDVQSFLTFDINPKFRLEFLGNVNSNKYLVIPTNRETTFGTVNDALKLTVYFDGRELMQYNT